MSTHNRHALWSVASKTPYLCTFLCGTPILNRASTFLYCLHPQSIDIISLSLFQNNFCGSSTVTAFFLQRLGNHTICGTRNHSTSSFYFLKQSSACLQPKYPHLFKLLLSRTVFTCDTQAVLLLWIANDIFCAFLE